MTIRYFKIYIIFFLTTGTLVFCQAQKVSSIKEKYVKRIVATLASDQMEGRQTFEAGIERASAFIESEFQAIGLQPLAGHENFKQVFSIKKIQPKQATLQLNGQEISEDNFFVFSDQTEIHWKSAKLLTIDLVFPIENLFQKMREVQKDGKDAIVFVDDVHRNTLQRIRSNFAKGRVVVSPNATTVLLVLGKRQAIEGLTLDAQNSVQEQALNNVVGVLEGKSKKNEMVVFSGHYDHLGIQKPMQGDTIANGADDDASGTTAVIALAKYYKKCNDNERTLVFTAFTAEEIGGYGSQYFSKQLNADSVVAMFNIEMIGKPSKFGTKAAFITGFERSNLGEILQKNSEGTGFAFHPDPYPEQNLFYRSDNATLARLGVPAHTISTDEIDIDKFYHTVDDEVETLDINNMTQTIRAIALSAVSIISGKDTPYRIDKDSVK